MGYRCGVCQAVSSEDIQTNLGDFKKSNKFVPDPKDERFHICLECKEVHEQLMYEYSAWYDDIWGWGEVVNVISLADNDNILEVVE